jgi:hypothetical protein
MRCLDAVNMGIITDRFQVPVFCNDQDICYLSWQGAHSPRSHGTRGLADRDNMDPALQGIMFKKFADGHIALNTPDGSIKTAEQQIPDL